VADSNIAVRWEKAKTDFEAMTGKSKPKPNGLLAKAFNHTGLSGSFKDADKLLDDIDAEKKDAKKRAALIAKAEKHAATIKKDVASYTKLLTDAITAEKNDNAGEKTLYAKGLKFLKTQLDALEKHYNATVANWKIAEDTSMGVADKAVAMVKKSLASTVANAAAGLKKIKTSPTPATFNEIFNTSDNIARKVQVQLIAAANGHKKGALPSSATKRVDPRSVADDMTPWQAGGKGEAIIADTATPQQVLAKMAEFARLLKLANAYLDDLTA
jgi:hypothetical protein